jgi:hypothetical protein
MDKIIKKGLLVIFILFLGIFEIYAATIQGFEPEYAGRILIFYIYSDPITKNETELFRLTIDQKGNFREEVELSGTAFCLSDFDVFKGMIILEPESSFKIKLPPLREKTLLESKNPYFKPIVLWIQTITGKEDEINHLVSKLEQRYNQLTSQYFNQLYYQNSLIYLDSVKSILHSEFSNYSQPLLKTQMELKLKQLEADVNPASHQKIFKGFFTSSLSYSNPTFIDLFNQLFADKLTYEANSVKAGELKKAINTGNALFIKNYFQEKFNLDNVLADYVLLKVFHDAYYSNQFQKKIIISMLDNSIFVNNADKKIKKIATDVKQKLLFLAPGSAAPVICLNDLEGQRQCSDKLKEYKYLIFADTEMLVCREHLKYLVTIASKFKDQLEIYVIVKYSDVSKIQKFFTENEVPGIKVIEENNNHFAGEYKVRSYPSAFLLNQKHEIVLAPAKNPLDGFEIEFASLLRYVRIQKFRNQR